MVDAATESYLNDPSIYFSNLQYQSDVIARFSGDSDKNDLVQAVLNCFNLDCENWFLMAFTGWGRIRSWVKVFSNRPDELIRQIYFNADLNSEHELLLKPDGTKCMYGLFCNESDYVISKIECGLC